MTFAPSAKAAWISFDVFFVASKPSMSGISLRISSGALASLSSNWSSKSRSWILYCVASAFKRCVSASRSGRSSPTVLASNWSSRPRSVAMKFIKVHCAAISGL